jgi:hypothetical protein
VRAAGSEGPDASSTGAGSWLIRPVGASAVGTVIPTKLLGLTLA